MSAEKRETKQINGFYNSLYYEEAKHNFADKKNRFNSYLIKNVLDIYSPGESEKILDVGCGWGNISIELLKRGLNVIGLDYSEKAIEICKKTAKKLGLDDAGFICENATKTKFENMSFDVIYCADLVEHLYPDDFFALLGEAKRILKMGGKLIIYTPNPFHIFELLKRYNIILKKDTSHVDYKTMDELKKSLSGNGFLVKKAYYIESHVPIINEIERMFINIIPIFRRRNAVLAIKIT